MINHMTLQGRFTKDPEFGTTNSGIACANFRLAWSEKYKDRETKCFLEGKALGPTAEFMQRNMNQKGQEVIAEGKLTTEEWTGNDGTKRSKNVLLVSNMHFCGKRQEGTNETHATAPVQEHQGGFSRVETDELPF